VIENQYVRSSLRRVRKRLRASLHKAREVPPASLRKARELFPYPRVWAVISATRRPSASITGRHTALVRPEGLAFSGTGDLMVVSNSDGNTVTIYSRGDELQGFFHGEPCGMLTDAIKLNFVHDVALSPCGKMLAAAAREDHSVSIFMRSKTQPNTFEAKPAWTIRGVASRLRFPAGVSFHPGGECLAVTNRQNSGITLFRIRRERDGCSIDFVPFQTISESDLLPLGLAAPHGVTFSPDGAFLMATHKRFYKTRNPDGASALTCFRWHTTPDLGLDPVPIYTALRGNSCLHSVAFHPSGRFFALTDESADVEVFEWRPQELSVRQVDRISIFRCGHSEGPKGVAFTSDGKQLAVTTVCDQVLSFSNWGHDKS